MVSKSITKWVTEAAHLCVVLKERKRVTLTVMPGFWSKVDARIEREQAGENDNEGGVGRTMEVELLGDICYHI